MSVTGLYLLVACVFFILPSTLSFVQRECHEDRFSALRETSPSFGETSVPLPSADVIADDLGVQRGSNFPRIFYRCSWKLHGYLLPILHLFDTAQSKDLDYSLKCLWCKALSGRDQRSPAFDDGMAYDMLPSGTRRLLTLPSRVFPRLIHFNIELRTAYLDRSLRQEVALYGSAKKIRLVSLGAGYDVRSIRFLTSELVQEAWEMDVLDVMRSKQVMLNRLVRRRERWQRPVKLPMMIVQDLNDVSGLENQISNILHTSVQRDKWHTIFLLEGVLIYLNDGVPASVLSTCSSALKAEGLSGSLIFADLFRGNSIRSNDVETVHEFLQIHGWDLERTSWRVKPGLARHMGVARVNATG